MNYRRMCFKDAIKGKLSLLHELLHNLGFMHQHQRVEAVHWGGNKYQPDQYTTFGPYDRFSAVGYEWTRELSDLDALKINRLYKCSRTTRGGHAISLEHTTPPVMGSVDPLKKVPANCGFTPNVAFTNVRHVIFNRTNKTITISNKFPDYDRRTTCELDERCYIPYVDIGIYGTQAHSIELKAGGEKCQPYYLAGEIYFLSPWPIKYTKKCQVAIQGIVSDKIEGQPIICLDMWTEFELLDDEGCTLEI